MLSPATHTGKNYALIDRRVSLRSASSFGFSTPLVSGFGSPRAPPRWRGPPPNAWRPAMRRLVAAPILAFLFVFAALRAEAVTYTWVGGSGASWPTSTSWSPVPTSAAITDRMVFDTGTAITVINVPNTNIAQIAVINGTQVTFRSSSNSNALVLNGDAGTDFVVGPNAMLSFDGPLNIVLQLATGTTG